MKVLIAAAFLFQIAHAEPVVIDDRALTKAFETGVGAFADKGGFPKAEELDALLKESPRSFSAPPEVKEAPKKPTDSMFIIGSVYKCDKCDNWHARSMASAWCLSADGLMVTNHHVLEGLKGDAVGIMDRKGNSWPVTEILASNPDTDIAIFRVEGEGFSPFPLGKSPNAGEEISVVSNPDHRFFMQTWGRVARYHARAKSGDKSKTPKKHTWMSITADYAKGSSGGPVINGHGEVVGMVASTQSIYYNSDNGKPKGPLQMVIKDCVPVSSIRKMLQH